MEELNHTQSVVVTDEEGFDTVTSVNMHEAFSLAQIDEDGDMHNVVIGQAQAAALMKHLAEFLG